MPETTALLLLVSITVFVLVSIGLLILASFKEHTDRMKDPYGDYPYLGGRTDER